MVQFTVDKALLLPSFLRSFLPSSLLPSFLSSFLPSFLLIMPFHTIRNISEKSQKCFYDAGTCLIHLVDICQVFLTISLISVSPDHLKSENANYYSRKANVLRGKVSKLKSNGVYSKGYGSQSKLFRAKEIPRKFLHVLKIFI